MNKVAAVVVTYNRIELLKQCVEKILTQSQSCDILLVDNASNDGTEAWALVQVAKYDNIFYQNTGANIGGAGGFNFGMRWAVEAGYEYVWVMDDDCLPYEDALEELLKADDILQVNYGWLTSVALWKDGHECNMNRPKLKKNFYDYLELMQYGLVQAEQATFVSLFLKTEIIKQAGLPIKEFFIWGDDIEYTRRIAVRKQIPSFVVGKSKVLHAMKDNTGSSIATDVGERIERYNYAFRNENYLYRQEGIKGFVYYFLKCGYNILKIIRFAPNKKIHRVWIVMKNMLVGLAFNPAIEKVEINA